MKIGKDHYETMRSAVEAVIEMHPDCRERYAELGLSNMRLNFDLFHAAQINGDRSSKWVCDTLYPIGVTDTHIATALARIVGNDGLDRNGRR